MKATNQTPVGRRPSARTRTAARGVSDCRHHPLRIMYLTAGPEGDQLYGAELCLLNLVDGLDPSQYEPCAAIVAKRGSPSLSDAFSARGVPVHDARPLHPLRLRSPWTWPQFAGGLGYCLGRAERAAPDVIHVNGLQLSQYAALVARVLGVPWICHLRLMPSVREYRAHLAFMSDRIVVESRSVAAVWQSLPHTDARLKVIYNGVDLAQFEEVWSARRLEPRPVEPGRTVMGVVAEFHPEKGHDVLLRAMSQVAAAGTHIRLLVIGDAPGASGQAYKNDLLSRVAELGLGDIVEFTGSIADPQQIYRQLDALVLPSLSETFGRVLVEAMAAGLPVIATRSGGPAEVVEHERTGLLVPVSDVESLAGAIVTLARDPDLRVRYGRAGRERAVSSFSIHAHATQVEAVYEELARVWHDGQHARNSSPPKDR